MKKILEWIKSPKSDFAFFAIFLILLNIVGYNSYARIDLTGAKSYSLSKESKNLVKNLQEPISVKVFFDDKLPAPYNNVKQYVYDILEEYKGAGNKNFKVSYMDMSKNENVTLARDLGISQIQIQEVKNNEIGFKQGFMGLAINYGDNVEIINPITSADGFEYNLTSKMSKMINTADTLAGLNDDEKITLTFYFSDVLKELGISGSDEIGEIVKSAFDFVNHQNMDRLEFVTVSPVTSEVAALCKQYGIQQINYKNNDGTYGQAAFGLVLSYGKKFYSIPVFVKNSLFGYMITGLENLETSITEGLQSLLSNVTEVGYVIGHGELDHNDPNMAGNFGSIVEGLYEFVDIDLSRENIPAGMNTVVINGPQSDYKEEELYKIDQFIMRGGNVLFFVDSVLFDEQAQYTGGSPFKPNLTNIDKLLTKYGVKRDLNVVMDKNCYEDFNPQFGKLQLNWAPVLQKEQLAKKNPITNNLGYVVMLQNGSLDVSAAEANDNLDVTVLAKSSPESWTVENDIILHPMYITPPADESVYKSENLAVLIEGKFDSAFDKAVKITEYDEDGNVIELEDGDMTTTNHLSTGVMPGKIFVTSSSSITTAQVIDDVGKTPISMFLMNVIDYMNGNVELCEMRTKNLDVHTLTIKTPAAANFWKIFNQFGLAAIVALAGLFVWRKREARRKLIDQKYGAADRYLKNETSSKKSDKKSE